MWVIITAAIVLAVVLVALIAMDIRRRRRSLDPMRASDGAEKISSAALRARRRQTKVEHRRDPIIGVGP